MGLSPRHESDVSSRYVWDLWQGWGGWGWVQRAGGCPRGSGASRGILQDSLKSLGNRYQRSQEGQKRAVCLKSKGRGAMGLENGCEGRIESWEEEGGAGERRGGLANSSHQGFLKEVVPLFRGALSRDQHRSELVSSVFCSPLTRTVDSIPSLRCSFCVES